MSQPLFATGYVPSGLDPRDWPFKAFGLVQSEEVLEDEWILPNWRVDRNQGAVSSCVAHTLDILRSYQETDETGLPIDLSEQFIYAMRGHYSDGEYRPNPYYHHGPGMQPRFALAAMRDYGTPPRALWPGCVEYGKEIWPSNLIELFTAAEAHKIGSYALVNAQNSTEMRSAIKARKGVAYCIPLATNFKPNKYGEIPMPQGDIWGYHCMRNIGWRKYTSTPGRTGDYKVPNTWGPEWGDEGACWIPWEYPVTEVWAIMDVPTLEVTRVEGWTDSKRYRVNGQWVEKDSAPQLIEGRHKAPLRTIAELFGDEVNYKDLGDSKFWFEIIRRSKM